MDGRIMAFLPALMMAGCATSASQQGRLAQHAETPPFDLPAANLPMARRHEPTARLVAHQEAAPEAKTPMEGGTKVEELVAFAIANNPAAAAARARAASLLSRVPQARSLDDPLLTSTVFLEQIQTAAGPQDVILSLSQKFPWFGKLNARGEIAYHDAQVAYAELADVELGVVEAVKLAYFDLYFIDAALRVYRELEPKIKDVIAIARTRYETNAPNVGLESVLQAEITLHKLQITVAELQQAKLKAAARLAEALRLPSGADLDIHTELAKETLPANVASLVAMIEFCHPRISAGRRAVTRDNWSVELARKEYYPDVNLGFNWIAVGENGLSAVANGRDAFSLTVGVNLPIYRAQRDAAVREARYKTAYSARRLDAARNTLRADVEKFHADAGEHSRVLRILNEDILRKAEQTFELSVEAYRVGRIGFQQLIDNYESLLRFRIDHHLRRARREQAIARLERAVGCAVAQWQGQTTK